MNTLDLAHAIREGKKEAESQHRDPFTGIPTDPQGYDFLEDEDNK